ncbi:MAG: hypothetical protein JRJ60_03865 [Deltaproteobacteria bacterium]|nr:hypothetical protein [Deltaproteobacteria bacterium]
MVFLFAGIVIGWWIYVPIHELLHAAGCLIAGGDVSKLEIKAIYGGGVLSHIFSFVVSGSDYAGRLSGFDTHGSDWAYGLLVYFPFLLSFCGFSGLEMGARRKNSFLFAFFLPIALAPIISLTGDFLELGTLLLFQFWPGPSEIHRSLISDDLFLLMKQMSEGTDGVPSGPKSVVFVSLSFLAGAVMAWGTVLISDGVRAAFFKGRPGA